MNKGGNDKVTAVSYQCKVCGSRVKISVINSNTKNMKWNMEGNQCIRCFDPLHEYSKKLRF